MITEYALPKRRTLYGRGYFAITEGLLLMFFVVIFSCLYIARDLLGIDFPDLVLSGLCGIAFLLLSAGSSLSILVYTSVLTVPHNEIMILYVILTLAKQYKNGKIHLQSRMTILTIVLLVIQMTNMALYDKSNWTTVIYDYITTILYVIIPMIWFSCDTTPQDYRRSTVCFVWGMLLGAAVVMVLTARMIGWDALVRGSQYQRLGITVQEDSVAMQTTYNANQLSGMMAISISLLFVFIEKRMIPRLLGFAGIAFAILIVFMTKSRTGLLCSCGASALYLAYIVVTKKKWLQGIAYILFAVLIVIAITRVFPDLLTGFFKRIEGQKDITNGRADLFTIYLREWSSNLWCLLFGYGIKSYQDVVVAFEVTHNSLTDILICCGGVGLVCVVATLVMFYRTSAVKLKRVNRFLAFLPAIVAIVMSIAGQYLTTGFPHMRLCFLLLSAQGWNKG